MEMAVSRAGGSQGRGGEGGGASPFSPSSLLSFLTIYNSTINRFGIMHSLPHSLTPSLTHSVGVCGGEGRGARARTRGGSGAVRRCCPLTAINFALD